MRVTKGSAADKAGILPGCILLDVGGRDALVDGTRYSDIVTWMRTAKRPLDLKLRCPLSPGEALTALSEDSRHSFVSVFAIVIGHSARRGCWNAEYTLGLLRSVCGYCGLDDARAFEPFLAPDLLSVTPRKVTKRQSAAQLFSVGNACAAFLPTIGATPQLRCQIWTHCLTLHMLSTGVYDARARVAFRACAIGLGFTAVWAAIEEERLASRVRAEIGFLMDNNGQGGISTPSNNVQNIDEAKEKANTLSSWGNFKKAAGIGAATIIGGGLIALTAGLAAPAIAAGIGTVAGGLGIGAATAGVVTFLGTTGGVVVLSSVLGVGAGGLTGFKMAKRLDGVDDFEFERILDGDENVEDAGMESSDTMSSTSGGTAAKPPASHLSTCISVSGWLHTLATLG